MPRNHRRAGFGGLFMAIVAVLIIMIVIALALLWVRLVNASSQHTQWVGEMSLYRVNTSGAPQPTVVGEYCLTYTQTTTTTTKTSSEIIITTTRTTYLTCPSGLTTGRMYNATG